MNNPRITVLALGGTIAMTASAQGGVVPTLDGEALVKAVPELARVAEIEARSFRQLPGAHLSFDDVEALAEAIEQAAAQGSRGIVVTQGTDTIEETAFALDRLLDLDIPVVVTGAMRNPTVAGADGPANLLAAVQCATSDEARGLGCMVVLNGEIHAARFVRKMHTTSPGAFGSPLAGPLGWVTESRVRVVTRPSPIAALARAQRPYEARVALVTAGLGDDGLLVDAALGAGAAGIVVEALGGGHVPVRMATALGSAAAKIPVVLASRTGAGEILASTYGFTGSEIDLKRRGVLRAGWLDGPKARILLTLLLRHGDRSTAQLTRALEAWGGG